MRTFDCSPMFRYSVGFDRMQRLIDTATARSEVTYPPYNIETDGEDLYRITIAVASFGEDDLDVILENDTMTIKGKKANDIDSSVFLHRGIAGRDFQLKFNLAQHIKVKSANLENGVLEVDLEREVPDELKPRMIEINTGPLTSLIKKSNKIVNTDKKAA